MSCYDPWPEMGELNDYEYFEQFDKQKLVKICVAHMRRARLEIVIRKNCEDEMDEARRFGEDCAKMLAEIQRDGGPKIPWEVGK